MNNKKVGMAELYTFCTKHNLMPSQVMPYVEHNGKLPANKEELTGFINNNVNSNKGANNE